MLNITGAGNLTRTPELGETKTGKAVTTVSVACRGRNRDDEPTYVDLKLWETQAENAVQYLTKGQAVSFTGRPAARAFERTNGDPGAALEVHAVELEYGAKPANHETETAAAAA